MVRLGKLVLVAFLAFAAGPALARKDECGLSQPEEERHHHHAHHKHHHHKHHHKHQGHRRHHHKHHHHHHKHHSHHSKHHHHKHTSTHTQKHTVTKEHSTKHAKPTKHHASPKPSHTHSTTTTTKKAVSAAPHNPSQGTHPPKHVQTAQHMVYFRSNCRSAIMQLPNKRVVGVGTYAYDGEVNSAIASAGPEHCDLNGVPCISVEFTLNDKYTTADITLIKPHVYTGRTKFTLLPGGSSAECDNPNCGPKNAFFQFDDYSAQRYEPSRNSSIDIEIMC